MMKLVLFLLLVCELTAHLPRVSATTSCMTGLKMTSESIPSMNQVPVAKVCPAGSACSLVSITSSGIEMEIGQCILSSACPMITCDAIKRQTSAMMPTLQMDSMPCSAKCCEDGSCTVTPQVAQMPVLPPTQISATTSCMTGLKMTSESIPSMNQVPVAKMCPAGSACSLVSITSPGIEMEIGQCIPSSACPMITCDAIKRQTSEMMPTLQMDSMPCSAKCCEAGSCTVTPQVAQMPVLPPTQTCQIPMWNAMVEDNFIGTGNNRAKPNFELIVKMPKKGYKPGKSYSVFVRSKNKKIRIQKFYITLNASGCSCTEESSPCPKGRFQGSRLRIAYAPQVERGCDEPLVSNHDRSSFKKSPVAKWMAPRDCHDSIIEMRAVVIGENGIMYQSNDGADQFLTKVLRPKPKKGKKGKKKNKKNKKKGRNNL